MLKSSVFALGRGGGVCDGKLVTSGGGGGYLSKKFNQVPHDFNTCKHVFDSLSKRIPGTDFPVFACCLQVMGDVDRG